MAKSTQHFTRDGFPMIETRVTRNGVLISVGNEMTEGDVPISPVEYEAAVDELLISNEAKKAAANASVTDIRNEQAIHREAAKAKLIVLGLTESEIESLTSNL